MEIRIALYPKTIEHEFQLNNHVEFDKVGVENYNTLFYCHGLSIANKYSDDNFNERKMNYYLEEEITQISKLATSNCYYLDYHEHADIPSIRIMKLSKESKEQITKETFENETQLNLYKLIDNKYKQFVEKIASS